jgi:hypothetical protein
MRAGTAFAVILGAAACTAPDPVSPPVSVALRDVQPLLGGQDLYLHGDGAAVAVVVERGRFKRYRLGPSPHRASGSANLLKRFDPREIPSSTRPGQPDESKPGIHGVLASGERFDVERWVGDEHPQFSTIYGWLLNVVYDAAKGKPEAEGLYDPAWRPEGF